MTMWWVWVWGCECVRVEEGGKGVDCGGIRVRGCLKWAAQLVAIKGATDCLTTTLTKQFCILHRYTYTPNCAHRAHVCKVHANISYTIYRDKRKPSALTDITFFLPIRVLHTLIVYYTQIQYKQRND